MACTMLVQLIIIIISDNNTNVDRTLINDHNKIFLTMVYVN